MRKYSSLLLSALTLSFLSLIFSSCKDDEPPAKPKLSFASSTMTVKESDENIEIQVVLDKAASEDITIDFSLSGTALDDVTAGTSEPSDYEVVSDYGEVEIKKGETTGIIELDIYSDSDFEDEDETIEISIEDVDSDEIEITRDDEITITVQQEDGLIVLLEWGVGDGENYTDVDLDLFLWAENSSSVLVRTGYIGLSGSNYTSVRGSYLSPEYFFLPTALAEDGSFGLSCTYYEGTVEPMNFEVSFIEIINGDDVSTVTKQGTFALANINKWDDDATGTDPVLIVKFKKAGTDFTDFEDIVVPGTGSRIGSSGEIAPTLKKQNTPLIPSERMKSFFKKFNKK